MTEDEAKKTLNKKGLGFKVVAREESKKYEEGTVSKQKTEAGKRVAKNTTIQVAVSYTHLYAYWAAAACYMRMK